MLLGLSSVATGAEHKGARPGGGGTRPPTVDRHGLKIRANPRFFWGGVGASDSSPPDLLTDGEGARCADSPQKFHPASALQITSPVCPRL